MLKIDEVAFAKLVCNGKVYRAPLVVYPDRVDGRWWRKDGMAFSPEDFDSVIEAKPEIVVLGTGFSGSVNVLDETKQRFEREGIEYVIDTTPEAVERFNELAESRRTVGGFYPM